MSSKVSVIIPVYNAEKHLDQCISSLVKQTLKNCEFIFVNDGSTDTSDELIKSYQKADSRIKLISQLNQGVSSARNTGLRAAAGEYVGFVDADDWVEEDMFEQLYNTCAGYDAVISNFECEIDGRFSITSFPFPVNKNLNKDFIQTVILPYFFKNDNLNSIWNKLYRNQLIQQHSLQFPKGVALGEDGLFNIRFMSRANNIIYTDYAGYHYKEVANSATRNINEKDYFKTAVEVYKAEIPEEVAVKASKEMIKEFKSIKLINSVLSFIHIYSAPSEEVSWQKRKNYIKKMIDNNCVKEALPIYLQTAYPVLGRYDKCLVQFVAARSLLGLSLLTAYSRKRNKPNGGESL